ncbi:hypothetical protein NQZ68_024840, partial [Dissostichus eleginoides]
DVGGEPGMCGPSRTTKPAIDLKGELPSSPESEGSSRSTLQRSPRPDWLMKGS